MHFILKLIFIKTKLILSKNDKRTLRRQINTIIQVLILHRSDGDILKTYNNTNVSAFFLKIGYW